MKGKNLDNNMQFLSGGGEMGKLTREKDWSKTSLGAPQYWPQSLRTALGIILNSKFSMFLFWGEELICFYNDAYRFGLGNEGKHPSILGCKGEEAWAEIWDMLNPLIDGILSGEEAILAEDQFIPVHRNGRMEDAYWTYCLSPVNDETGKPVGILSTNTETTEKIIAFNNIKESEKRFRDMVAQAPVAITVMRGIDYNLEVINEKMLELYGKTEEQVVNKPIFEAFPEAKEQGFEELLDGVYKTGIPFIGNELTVQSLKTGVPETLYLNFVYEPLYDENKIISGIMCVATDVTEQVISRKKIEESENKFRSVIFNAPTATCLFVGRDLVIESPNKASIEIGGKDYDIEGQKLQDAFPELISEKQPILQILDDVFTSGEEFSSLGTLIKILKNGVLTERYYNVSYKPLFNVDGKVWAILNTAIDVTKQIEAQQKIAESEMRFRNMVAQAPVAIAVFRGADFIVEVANERVLELWGKTAEQMMNKPAFEAMPDAAGQGFEELMNEVYKTGKRFAGNELPVNLIRKGVPQNLFLNFVYEPLYDENKNISGIMVVGTEVTEQVISRKKIEESEKQLRELSISLEEKVKSRTQELKQTEKFLQSIIDSSPAILFNFESVRNNEGEIIDFKLIFVNSQIEKETGQAASSIIGKTCKEIFPHMFENGEFERFVQCVQSGEKVNYEGYYHYEGVTSYYYVLAGKFNDGFASTSINITRAKNTALQLEKVNKQLKERNILVELKQQEIALAHEDIKLKNIELEHTNNELQSFAYISSHDLQEPLRKIQTFASRIREKEENNLSEQGKDFFKRMQDAANRMQTLIQDLLAYSRTNSEEREFENTDLNKIIDEIIEDFSEDLKDKHATIEATELCEANIIPFQFSQLMHNLITNALKFRKPENPPHIIIKSKIAKGITLDNPKLSPEDKYCHITVSDNGIGFEQQYSEKIFQVFQRLHGKNEYNGTGIGLAIVKKIVENHNGIITVTSELNQGGTFDIYIPAT